MGTYKELREICKCINDKRNKEQKALCLQIGRCEMDTPSFRRAQNVALLQELISDDKPEEVNE